jgi:hypothetical protein
MSRLPLRIPGALLLALCCAAGPAGAQEPKAPGAGAKTVTLPAGEFHEECMELAARQRLEYSFHSAAPLEFNIHYHRGNRIHYPVLRKGVTALSGTYSPQRGDGYCMMWRNPRKSPVELDYRFKTAAKK